MIGNGLLIIRQVIGVASFLMIRFIRSPFYGML